MVQAVMMDGGGGGGGFLDIPSVLITGGGTVCAVLVAFTLQEIKTVPQVLRKAIFKQELLDRRNADHTVRLAEKRAGRTLGVGGRPRGIDDSFMRKGIQLVVDGTDHNMVRDVLETDLMSSSRGMRGPLDP